ncbi:MAG TPA: symporter, partial [Desulfurococcales archaeon]|nr:symporter [Desulfurococcales archaeon]
MSVQVGIKREHWATKIGLILAMAGNAIGLGNFIRFPAKAAAYGGGAYLIPYFIALFLLGIPIMFVEWVLGRYGGSFGHGHLAPMLYVACRRRLPPRIAAWYAIIGGAIAFVTGVMITGYYTNIIGWMAFYAASSLGGVFSAFKTAKDAINYLVNFLTSPGYNLPAWLISLFIIAFIVSRGIRRGIEIAAKIMMPILFIEGIILVILSLTLGAPVKPEWTSIKGFEWLWTPKLAKLGDPAAFIEGAGQIFFTLSIGIAGIIPNYASYLRREDDIPLSALTTTSLNEFAEVVMGASIAIPLAYAFGGPPLMAKVEAGMSGFILSVSALPPLFGRLGVVGALGGFLWFSLLWFAGVTSAIALVNVITAIFEEDFNIARRKGAWIAFAIVFLTGVFVNIEGAMKTKELTDYLDLADFYAGSLLLLVVALIEVIAVLWLWG